MDFGVAERRDAFEAAGATRRSRRTRCGRPAGICSAPVAWATTPTVGRRRLGPRPRRRQPVHRRRQRVRHQRRGQSDHDHPGRRAADGGLHQTHARSNVNVEPSVAGPQSAPSVVSERRAAQRQPYRRRPTSPIARGTQSRRAGACRPVRRWRPGRRASIERTLATAPKLRRLFLDGLVQVAIASQQESAVRSQTSIKHNKREFWSWSSCSRRRSS